MLYLALTITLLLIRSFIEKYDRVFSPFTLSLRIPLLFLLIPQIIAINVGLDEDYLLSDIVTLLNIFFVHIGSRINCHFWAVKEIKNANLISMISICIVCVLFLTMLPLLISYGLSLEEVRDSYEAIIFSPYAFLCEILKTLPIIIVILRSLKTQEPTIGIFIVVFFLIFSGSKMAIPSTLTVFVTMYEEYKKVNYTYASFFSLSSFISMLLYHYSQSSQTGIGVAALSYFDLHRRRSIVTDMLQRNQADYYNERIYISSQYKLIPRLLWPGRPVDYGLALLNYRIYLEYSTEGHMPPFGLGYAYADLGLYVAVSDGFLIGFLRNFFYSISRRSGRNNTSFTLYILTLNIMISILLIAYSFCNELKLETK